MGRSNGGLIGKINVTSFGDNTVTSKTSSGTLTVQPGTRIVDALIIAGGGGYVCSSNIPVSGPFSITVGGGGAGEPVPANSGATSGSNSVLGCTTATGGVTAKLEVLVIET